MNTTRRFVLLLGSAGITAALLAGPAGAAATTSTTAKPSSTTTTAKSASSTNSQTTKSAAHKSRRFVVVVGTFPSRAAAQKRVEALAAKGLKGFAIKVHSTKKTSRSFQVEHPAASQRAASIEAKRVRAAGFRVRIVAS